MTGPTTAGQLLELAKHELQQLQRQASTPHAAPADGLAAAWPGFHRAADRLIATLRAERPADARHDAPSRQPQPPPRPNGRPDPHLQRATELISAAADLLSTRDRRVLSEQERAADVTYVGKHLAGSAYVVAVAAIDRPDLLSTVQAAAGAAVSWRGSATDMERPVDTTISLADATTAPSRPDPTDPDPAGLARALTDWHNAAATAAHQPAPSRADLLASAMTAGSLLALSQVVLRSHADDLGASDAVSATAEHIRRAGHSCNNAAQAWQFTATGHSSISPELRQATIALDKAISQFARDGASWASPEAVRDQAPREVALELARGALTAARDVVEQHTAVVTQLGETGALYAPATRLPVSEERVEAILDRKWVRLTAEEASPLVEGYQQLADATTVASLTYTALTTPSLTGAPAASTAPTLSVDPAPQIASLPADPEPVAATVAGQRWLQTLADLDPRLLADPHYPALAAALDRVELAGANVTASLEAATAAPLPDKHTARTLHYKLIDVCPAASTPYTHVQDTIRAASQHTPHLSQGVSAALRAQEAPGRSSPSW